VIAHSLIFKERQKVRLHNCSFEMNKCAKNVQKSANFKIALLKDRTIALLKRANVQKYAK